MPRLLPLFPEPFFRRASAAGLLALMLAACGSDDGDTGAFVPFENTGENCDNFMVIAPANAEVAQRLVPAPFEIVRPALAFVEMADCEDGSINGVPTGPFRISEAAIFVQPPGGGLGLDIFTLWQVDTSPELSALKRDAGFPGGVVPGIVFEAGLLDASAEIPYEPSPYVMSALVTAVGVPGPPLVNELWQVGPRGVVHTTNDIFRTDSIRAGVGRVTLQEGSVLHELFGSTTVVGVSAQGRGTFHNYTRLEPELNPPLDP